MKKLLTILFLFAVIGNLFADISVKSFRKLENDLDARVNFPIKDFSGDVSAIIKVVTTETGFTFDCGQVGIVTTVNKPAEIWVYVPYGVKRITISHPKLGQLRDWFFTQPIEKATVYEMILTSGKVITTVDETIESQWLVINPVPVDAAIYIDNVFVKAGIYSAKYKPGSYSYRVEAPLYHTEAGKVEITESKKEFNVILKPAFGYVIVNTEPEKDARVIIDGKTQINNSPCTSEALASGEHVVQVIKDMYQPTTQKVKVIDGQTTPMKFIMQPNFAELTLNSPIKAVLYINNQQKSTGTWNGRLNAGIYSLEARLDKYRTAKQDIELKAGDKKTIDLQPIPIYGSLDIISSPLGAKITIDGKEYGTTPNTISKLLIGDYMIQLTKAGFASVNKLISVIEGKSVEINEKLMNSGPLKINSTPPNADIFIDEKLIGKTPLNTELSYGKHTIKLTQEDKTNTQEIEFTAESSSELNIELYECNKNKLIYCTPGNAKVFVNGKEQGNTPLSYKMLNKEEKITIKKEGYKTYKATLYCQGSSFSVNLIKKTDIIELLKNIKYRDFFSLGVRMESGDMNENAKLGLGIELDVKFFKWLFIRNEINTGIWGVNNFNFYSNRNHLVCLGIPVGNYGNTIYGEYGINYVNKFYGGGYGIRNIYNIYGLGFGNYTNSLGIRYNGVNTFELYLRFPIFKGDNTVFRY